MAALTIFRSRSPTSTGSPGLSMPGNHVTSHLANVWMPSAGCTSAFVKTVSRVTRV